MIDLASIPGVYACVNTNGVVEFALARDADPGLVVTIITTIIGAAAKSGSAARAPRTAAPASDAPVAQSADAALATRVIHTASDRVVMVLRTVGATARH